MGYLRRRNIGLGDTSIAEKIATIAQGAATAADIATDPYLPETICRAQQLIAIENGRALPNCASTPRGKTGGIGLRKLITPLRAMVYAEQNPWVYPAAVVAAVGVPLAIGYLLGKGRR